MRSVWGGSIDGGSRCNPQKDLEQVINPAQHDSNSCSPTLAWAPPRGHGGSSTQHMQGQEPGCWRHQQWVQSERSSPASSNEHCPLLTPKLSLHWTWLKVHS